MHPSFPVTSIASLMFPPGTNEYPQRPLIEVPGFRAQILLTITDDFPYAQAVVMIEALPIAWIA